MVDNSRTWGDDIFGGFRKVDNPKPAEDGLKPCPLCDGEAYNFTDGTSAMCVTKGCGLENIHMTHDQWNTRPDTQTDLGEALRTIREIMKNNYGRQTEKLGDITYIADEALEKAGVK